MAVTMLGWTLLMLAVLLSLVAANNGSNSVSQIKKQELVSNQLGSAEAHIVQDKMPMGGAPLSPSTGAGASNSASEALTDELATELERSLRFEPPLLDFGEACPVGTTRAHTVTLVNRNANRSVYLTSVSGRTAAFYSSFFEAKVVPPLGNTTFSVVFLPRSYGAITADLLIHTSFGQARLQVRGEGRECPYRLKPLVGVKAPLNATLTPEIHMYNPHGNPLQILEVYSSGGQFQLELPSGGQEGPQTLWEIPPYTTKPVIRIRFHARSAGNHTAYIRIKISEQPAGADSASENVLVIPVEFEILSKSGLYAVNPLLDFGRISTTTESGHSKAHSHQIKLQLRVSQADCQQEVIDYHLRNMTGLIFEPSDATVTLEPRQFTSTTVLDEVLVLRAASHRNASETHEFTVLIRAEVFKGTLHYDRNTTIFVTQTATVVSRTVRQKRTLVVRNDFEQPLALLQVSLAQNDSSVLWLRLSDTYTAIANSNTGEVVLSPGQSLKLMQLQLQDVNTIFKTMLHVRTNITHFDLPIMVCSGRLHVSTYDTARITTDPVYSLELNLGAIPLAEMSHDGYIVLRNRNPLSIKLNTWDFQSPQGVYFHTTFRGCLRPASLRALQNSALKLESIKFKLCTQLEEDDVAVFQVAIQSYITEHHTGTLKIWTAYEEIVTTVRFRTWMGKLEVDQEQLYFKNCFPGKRCTAELSIRSTFQDPIHVSSINFTDVGLHFEDFNVNGSIIGANTVTKVGRIHFEPALLCQNRCYIPQDERTNVIAFPSPQQTKGGRNNNLQFDEMELRRRTELFRQLKWYLQDIAFTLNSHEVRQFLLQLIIDIEWPKLVAGKQVLSTIEVGKAQESNIVLSNPAASPVLVDYFLADPRYAKETQLSLPLEVVDISPNCYLTDQAVFSLPNGTPRQPILVPPHTSLPIVVRFEAQAADTYCTLLHIRNNLTLYEAVWLSAKTVQSQFRFGNRKPGSSTPLLFEVSEKHLATCAQQSQYQQQEALSSGKYPQVVTKRTFTARNTGEIPIWVETFLIGDQSCAGYGFKVLDCSSFALKANDSKKIEIAFSPDFTASRISRPLTLRTNLSYDVGYVLLAQLPSISLDQCVASLPRPVWEERVRNAAIVILATTFVFVLIAAHIDYGNILISQSALYMARDKGPIHPTFNLRNIALKASQRHPTEEEQQSAVSITAGPSQAQGQRRNIAQQKNTGGAGGNSANSNLKKRGLRRNNNPNGSLAVGSSQIRTNSTIASLPWTLNLSALKCVPTAKTPVGDSCTDSPSESNSKSSSPASTLVTQIEREVVATASGSGNVSNSMKKQQLQQSQQSRSTKKSRNMLTTTTTVTTTINAAPTLVGSQDKVEKDIGAVREKQTGGGGRSTRAVDRTETPSSSPNARTCLTETAAFATPIAAKDTNGNMRLSKYGKTPGRERRKDIQNQLSSSTTNAPLPNDVSQSGSSSASCSSNSSNNSSNSKRAERKQRMKQMASNQALSFGAASHACLGNGAGGDTVPLGCMNSPWETSSQVSFRDVLQTSVDSSSFAGNMQRNVMTSAVDTNETICGLGALYDLKNNIESEHSLLDLELKRQQSDQDVYSHDTLPTVGGVMMDKTGNNSAELGPIGSKKSPSSTPVWEPVNNQATLPAIQMPKPMLTAQNCSFFSNVLQSYEYGGSQQARGVDMDLFDSNKLTEEYIRYMCMRQQLEAQAHAQAQAQAQVQAHQQLLHQGLDWGRPTWTPMTAYLGQQGVNNVSTISAMATGTSGVSSNAPTMGALDSCSSAWQINRPGAAVVRPPPGLESNIQNMNGNGNMRHEVSVQQQQQPKQQQHQPMDASGDASDMQQYDPFSSLSAIWSDNWQKRNNGNMN